MFVRSLARTNCLNYNKFMSDEFILCPYHRFSFVPLRNAFAFSAPQQKKINRND